MNKDKLAALKKILASIRGEIKIIERILETDSLTHEENRQELNIAVPDQRRKSRPKLAQIDAVQRWNKVTDEIDKAVSIEDFRLFLSSLTSDDLSLFIKFNRLPINSKMKKVQIISGIMQLLKAGQAIQQPLGDNSQA